MSIRQSLALAAVFALLPASAAFAHAQLQTASPSAGATVEAPPEIRLNFSEAVEPRFCSVTLKSADGAAQPTGKPAAGDATTLVVKIGAKLKPGAYTVDWRAVSVDTHRTQGSFGFTVK
jgi:methionine-rich copper-binding protein CopC